MELYIAMTAIILVIGLWNLMIAILGCFPQCRETTVGTLLNARTRRNVRTRHGWIIPFQTRYAYIYTVKGKQYTYSNSQLASKRNLFPKATIVYVKGFPRHAYVNKFTGLTEWIVGGLLVVLGALYLYVIFQS